MWSIGNEIPDQSSQEGSALAKKKNGKICITQVFTTGASDAIRLSVDRMTIHAHLSDVAHESGNC